MLGSGLGSRSDLGVRLPCGHLKSPVGRPFRGLLAAGGKASTSGENPESMAYPRGQGSAHQQEAGDGLSVGEGMDFPGLEEAV